MDADELIAEFEERQYLARGLTAEEISKERQKKRDKENFVMLKEMLKLRAWEYDISVEAADVIVKLAGCYERMHNRSTAVQVLRQGLMTAKPSTSTTVFHPEFSELYQKRHRSTIVLAAAKLFFKENLKDEALLLCMELIEKFENGDEVDVVNVKQATDAYYVAGWIRIHADNHTEAYKLWARGHVAIPSSDVLARQARKRQVWDENWSWNDVEENISAYIGHGAHGDGKYDAQTDLSSYKVPDGEIEPALALFSSDTQQRKLVFRSNAAIMTPSECKNVVKEVEEHHKVHHDGVWGTVRESSVKTTDVAVEDITCLVPWLRCLLHTRIYPMLQAAYPRLADGSSIYDKEGACRMRVHDAFIVRYSEADKSLHLPKHCDTSAMSLTIALNSKEEDYSGGGICFDAIPGPDETHVFDASTGHAIAFAGPLRHGGHAITRGERLILVLFLYVEDYAYGSLLETYIANTRSKREEEQELGGPHRQGRGEYVVYRQTTELMAILESTE